MVRNYIAPQKFWLDTPPYQMGSLKREEIIATNSMILHEFYFANLGGDAKASGIIADLINATYGSLATWEQDFRLTSMSLGGGSGWVILNYNFRDNTVHNYCASNHTHSLAWRAAARDGYVRACLRAGLRGERARLPRRVFPEHQLG